LTGKGVKNRVFGESRIPLLAVPPRTGRNVALLVIFLLFAVLLVVGGGKGRELKLDPFHSGEQLGTVVSYEAGGVPYKDFIFVHGVFVDPLQPVLAFKLFGRSIGAFLTFTTLLEIVMFAMLCLYLLASFRGRFEYALTAVLSLMVLRDLEEFGVPQLIRLGNRDICTYAFLLTVIGLWRYVEENASGGRWRCFVLAFLWSFVPFASFGYSIDRGFFLSATAIVLAPALYLLFFRRSRYARGFLIASTLGFLSAVLLMGFMLRWHVAGFLDFVFLKMPRYKELMDGIVFPISDKRVLAVLVLVAANTFWVVLRFLQTLSGGQGWAAASREFLKNYLNEFTLLLASLFFFRHALGRSDLSHVAFGAIPTCLLSMIIVLRHYLPLWLERYRLEKIFTTAVIMLALLFAGVSVWRLSARDLLHEKFPIGVPDERFTPDDYKRALAFLKENLGPKDQFYTMTSEGVWYYWLDRPSPTRFPVIWFASPRFYQEEVVRDLSRSHVKILLYRNALWSNAIDNIPTLERLPIVAEYLARDYKPWCTIDHHEFWIRKGE
jgi:hypothetical protein